MPKIQKIASNEVRLWLQESKDRLPPQIYSQLLEIIGKPKLPPKPHVGAYQKWFNSLQPGDKVRIQFPWSDRNIEGGLIVIGTIQSKRPWEKGQRIRYRVPAGWRGDKYFSGPCGTYEHIMPMDRDSVYFPHFGYKLMKRKGPVHGIRRKLESDCAATQISL